MIPSLFGIVGIVTTNINCKLVSPVCHSARKQKYFPIFENCQRRFSLLFHEFADHIPILSSQLRLYIHNLYPREGNYRFLRHDGEDAGDAKADSKGNSVYRHRVRHACASGDKEIKDWLRKISVWEDKDLGESLRTTSVQSKRTSVQRRRTSV